MMRELVESVLAFLIGAVCGIFCTAMNKAAKKRDTIYDDYYDHDVSGLLEED